MEDRLSNSNLLDSEVSKNMNTNTNASYKNERLKKIQDAASDNTVRKETSFKNRPMQIVKDENNEYETPPIEGNEQMKNVSYTEVEKNTDDFDDNYLKRYQEKRMEKKHTEEEKKILGLKPVLFYGLLTLLGLGAGLVIYNKYIKKTNSNSEQIKDKIKGIDINNIKPNVSNLPNSSEKIIDGATNLNNISPN